MDQEQNLPAGRSGMRRAHSSRAFVTKAVVAALVVLVALPSTAGAAAPTPGSRPTEPGASRPDDEPGAQIQDRAAADGRIENQLIVQYRDGEGFRNDRSYRDVGQLIDETPELNARLVRVGNAVAAQKALRRNPHVALVSENYVGSFQFTPNDPYYGSQYHLGAFDGRTYGANLVNAWNLTAGYKGGRVVIVDSGINANHVDLKGKNPIGYNFANSNYDLTDCGGHGTRVAGVAAASTNNATGVAGADMWAGIYVAKVADCGQGGGISIYTVAKAVSTSAAWSGTRVINMSLAWYLSGTLNCAVIGCATASQEAINYLNTGVQSARNRNVVVIASSGNQNTSVASYPAAFSGVMGVAATDKAGGRASFSNFGNKTVDLAAPGVGIWTTDMNGGYANPNGTSFSAPLVAGIAMLVWSRYPNETEAGIRTRLTNATWNPELKCWRCYSSAYGYGVIDAYYAAR